MKVFIIICIVFLLFMMVAIYSCFILSGRMSEAERQREMNIKE